MNGRLVSAMPGVLCVVILLVGDDVLLLCVTGVILLGQ